MTQTKDYPIRLIGDAVLHRAAMAFPKQPSPQQIKQLKQQITIMQRDIVNHGGIGIAANQCATIETPYHVIIVGVNSNIREHIRKLVTRYDVDDLPKETIMINTHVLAQSEKSQTFAHGCLSVPGPIRADLVSPQTLTVAYQTLQGDQLIQQQATFQGMAAIVLYHELNHISHGFVYLDESLPQLSTEHRQKMQQLINNEITRRTLQGSIATQLTTPDFQHIVRHDAAQYRLDVDALKQALPGLALSVLQGIQQRLQRT